ncbi:hypothetical protein ACFSQ3_05920 [Sphingobacterium corticis]|uniref:Cardiolipin synthase N-terminal domain-containing protein n=1 Tax=Sphingobacterium corticis TaxID=1812823 RepID=A0ABW5NJA3_9SPHI
MQKIHHQTKQAFLFSLVFYILSIGLIIIRLPIAPMMFSISLLISMIWVVLVIREILRSPFINNTERMGLTVFIIFLNIIGGFVYFSMIRRKVLGIS